ncbi:hypothetical protein P879_03332 [Paragonimus westermani]|uniref:Gelsolin-like domain-containing protein n=1 Tax=Paragonimus westermani TaxID=34504 RepID=A0A8T0DMQ2_9TREM|nr:hypothetical protein P879_03332 [Paragonimus westermani]
MDEPSWQDTNLALFGSDEDRRVKKESAMEEEAWVPVLHTHEPRIFVWRIENFKVRPINEHDYGQFYNGDSYIVLNISKKNDTLAYDVHFWIGQHSTQDEYGTAAYKTVELDTLLDGAAVQHREVENHESKLFKSYFPTIRILNGGVKSGFRHVTPNEYQPRLLHFCLQEKEKLVVMSEVELSASSLNSGDVFILDLGTTAFQWNGKHSNKEERYQAAQFLHTLESERLGRCKTTVLDEESVEDNDEFLRALPNIPVKRTKKDMDVGKRMYRLSDESGELKFELIASNGAPRRIVNEDDVYFIDTSKELFVFLGSRCSIKEKQNALSYAHSYLQHSTHPLIPVTVLSANQHSDAMDEAWDPDRTQYYLH